MLPTTRDELRERQVIIWLVITKVAFNVGNAILISAATRWLIQKRRSVLEDCGSQDPR